MSDLFEDESRRLEAMAPRFVQALKDRDEGRLDEAEETLRNLVAEEPRLPEPHMELGRILLDTDRLEEAEGHAREALGYLEAGGQWNDEIPENVVLALCHALLAEILRRRADEDDVIFGDPDAFRRIVKESREHFEKAASLDDSDEYSSYYAFFMGLPGEGGAAGPAGSRGFGTDGDGGNGGD